ncbi:hypothetical protein A3Q56_06254 [Intoshia linei]|uniref:Uncharacterized protein n=1 Tax=Intoshia linei TaxID=1819745 RepID=A0A177AX89_9BILA|nr:hypothetical protein A3Q56_06254 [Intoshia linei]
MFTEEFVIDKQENIQEYDIVDINDFDKEPYIEKPKYNSFDNTKPKKRQQKDINLWGADNDGWGIIDNFEGVTSEKPNQRSTSNPNFHENPTPSQEDGFVNVNSDAMISFEDKLDPLSFFDNVPSNTRFKFD